MARRPDRKPTAKPAGKKQAPKPSDKAAPTFEMIDIDLLVLDPRNPRKTIDDAKIDELAQSIREIGRIMQPIAVRKINTRYMIIFGQRRWMAAKKAGRETVECLIHKVDDAEALDMMLLENLQRVDIDPVEEAVSLAELVKNRHSSQEIALRLGKGLHWIACRLKLARMPQAIQESVSRGEIGLKHVEELARIDDPDAQAQLASRSKYMTVVELHKHVEGMLRWLDKAPWPAQFRNVDDGPCTTCIMRTDRQNDLFGSTANAKCCNASCWDSMMEGYREFLTKRLKSAKKQMLPIEQLYPARHGDNGWCRTAADKQAAKDSGQKPWHHVTDECEVEEFYKKLERQSEDGSPDPDESEAETRCNPSVWAIEQKAKTIAAVLIASKKDDLGLQKILLVLALSRDIRVTDLKPVFGIQAQADMWKSEAKPAALMGWLIEDAVESIDFELLAPIIEECGYSPETILADAKALMISEDEE